MVQLTAYIPICKGNLSQTDNRTCIQLNVGNA